MIDLIPAEITPKKGKALLCFPPQWSPQNPHFSLRAIMGHLRSKGFEVAVRDLNVEYYDTVLDPAYLRQTADRIYSDLDYLKARAKRYEIIGDESKEAKLTILHYNVMQEFLDTKSNLLKFIPLHILDAKETLRDPRRFYNPDMLVEAFQTIDLALQIVSLPFHPARMYFNYFVQPDMILNVPDLIQLATTPERNLFYQYFKERIPELLAEKADYVGVSINAFSQILPGLTLAHLLKQSVPEGMHVSIGGNFFPRVKDVLLQHPEFFRTFADSLAMGEGEHQVTLLVDALAQQKPMLTVPNLLFLDADQTTVHETPAELAPKLDEIGVQDLAGLPLDKYFTPELVLTIQGSKGCYYGKCTFCDTDFGIRIDTKRLDSLVTEIKYLRDRYGIRHFMFIDEAIRPAYMEKMAQRFIDEELNISWFSNARLDKSITADRLKLLQQAGLRMMLWGFEAGSQRVLDLMKKGIDAKQRLDILRAADAVGIWNFAYIFFGFPTETLEEARSTIDALVEHQDIIHSYGRSVFTLGKQSPLYLDVKELGIVDIVEDAEELSTNLSYRMTQGMTKEELDEVVKECTMRYGEASKYNLWFFLRYRENIHLYVDHFGLEYVKNYQMTRYMVPKYRDQVF